MIKGTTSTGLEFEFDERKVEDYRVMLPAVELERKPNDTKAKLGFFAGLRDIIGDDLEKKIVDHVIKQEGFAASDIVAHEMGEIYSIARSALGETRRKNSISSPTVSQQTRMPLSATSQKPTGYTIINQSQSEQSQPYAPDSGTTAE